MSIWDTETRCRIVVDEMMNCRIKHKGEEITDLNQQLIETIFKTVLA